MKRRNIIYTLLASTAVLFAACNKQEAPSGALQIFQSGDYDAGELGNPLSENDAIYTGITMAFVVEGADGDVYSLWLGDTVAGTNFGDKDLAANKENPDKNYVAENAKGVAMSLANGKFFAKAFYENPGVFQTTMVGRNIYDKGDSYKEMTYTRNVTVLDSTAILFHSEETRTDYRFRFTTPALRHTKFTLLPGNKVQASFKQEGMANVKNGKMQIRAGKASVWFNGEELPYNEDGAYYSWEGVNFEVENTLVVKARSEGFEREYTILPVLLWE